MTALAGYLLLMLGHTERIIFSGGSTVPHLSKTEAKAMQYYVSLFDPEIVDQISLEEDSYDTYTNATYTYKLAATGQKVGLMSIGYHIQLRAKELFRGVFYELNQNQDQKLVEITSYIYSEAILNDINKLVISKLASGHELHELSKVRLEIKLLLEEYRQFAQPRGLIQPHGIRAHGPEYHFLVKLYQIVTRDPLGKKLSDRAQKRRTNLHSQEP